MLLKFEFHDDRPINDGAVGGRNWPSPIDKAHRLHNSLLLPHNPAQAVMTLWDSKITRSGTEFHR